MRDAQVFLNNISALGCFYLSSCLLLAAAELLEETDPETVSDALLIEGMWAAAEDPDDGDDEAENGDELLEALDPAEVS